MSLVNEAAVDAAVKEFVPDRSHGDSAAMEFGRQMVRKYLEAAAPHIGGEAIRQDKAEAWERAQVKYPCVADLGELLADDAHSTPCPACALKAVAEVLGIEVTP